LHRLRGVSWPTEAGNFSCWVETSPGRSYSRASAMAGTGTVTCARDGYTVVVLRGELDVCNAAGTVRMLTAHAASGTRIVIDLAELTFIDCGALREVVSVRAQARQAGGDLALADPQPLVLRLLVLTGVISRYQVFASVHDAVKGAPAALLVP
jgi:anti-anti-sigma factor